MKTRRKIILIGGISVVVVVAGIFLGPVIYMIVAIQYSGFIFSSTSDKVFEEEFNEIPEVELFIEKHPNYTTSHLQDIIGWKIIFYESKDQNDKSVNLQVKKNVLHKGVKISAGCRDNSQSLTFDIPQEQVIDYLKNNKCLVE